MVRSRAMNVEEIEGVGKTYANKLKTAGISTVEELLQKSGKKGGRQGLAQATGISERDILEWVNRADLIRVKGVGSEFSDLLEAAGVDSCTELAHRTPAHLHAKMAEVNASKNWFVVCRLNMRCRAGSPRRRVSPRSLSTKTI
jgi:predicted flap endonuclease-1-like 5' DNA nuclease